MAFTPFDTLQKQIQRGRVFWSVAVDSNAFLPTTIGTDNLVLVAVETGAAECFCKFEILCEATTGISVKEDVTSFVSLFPITTYNMKRSDTTTTMLTTVDEVSSFVGGTQIFGLSAVSDGEFPKNSPLNLESGMLLKPSTIYVYTLQNLGVAGSQLTISVFLREI